MGLALYPTPCLKSIHTKHCVVKPTKIMAKKIRNFFNKTQTCVREFQLNEFSIVLLLGLSFIVFAWRTAKWLYHSQEIDVSTEKLGELLMYL